MRKMTDLYQALAARLRSTIYWHSWKLAIVLAVAIVCAGGYVFWPRAEVPLAVPAAAISAADLEMAQDRSVIVYVNGAVQNPGLFTLSSSLRVVDAIVAAGGITPDADPTCLPNLAAHLKDAKQITVPFAGHCARGSKQIKLDINTAAREQLLAVAGMDPDLADAIIAYRQANGGFQSLTELKSSLGIDATLYKQLAKSLNVP